MKINKKSFVCSTYSRTYSVYQTFTEIVDSQYSHTDVWGNKDDNHIDMGHIVHNDDQHS